MSVINSIFLILLLGTLISILHAQNDAAEEGSRQFIDHPDKNEYLLSQPGTDKHKYGYELRENKHFHHTTTELDGVRLGCYGYVLNGKKYSTQYVADIKGYRPVYTYNVIEVFPKSGGTREASFIRNFDEAEDRSGNLRYFFPEGCRGFDSEISPDKNPMTSVIFGGTPSNGPFNVDKTRTDISNIPNKPPNKPLVPNRPPISPPKNPPPLRTSNPPPLGQKYLPPSAKYLPPSQQQTPVVGKYVTKAPAKTFPPPSLAIKPNLKPISNQPLIPKISPPAQNKITTTSKSNCEIGNCESQTITVKMSIPGGGCVDDDSLPKIVIPIKLKNGRPDSCPSYAKLIVPADSVSVNSLKSNPTELAKMVLQSLA